MYSCCRLTGLGLGLGLNILVLFPSLKKTLNPLESPSCDIASLTIRETCTRVYCAISRAFYSNPTPYIACLRQKLPNDASVFGALQL